MPIVSSVIFFLNSYSHDLERPSFSFLYSRAYIVSWSNFCSVFSITSYRKTRTNLANPILDKVQLKLVSLNLYQLLAPNDFIFPLTSSNS